MKVFIILLCVIFCIMICTSKNQQTRIARQVFVDYMDDHLSPLDEALHKSHEENKPLLLMISAYAYSNDNIVIHKINNSPWISNYILDSMINCLLILDSKFKITRIKNRELEVLLPQDTSFKNQGNLAMWIFKNYCNNAYESMVVVDHKMNNYSSYEFSPSILKDSIAFMNYLRTAKHKFDSLNSKR